MKKVTIILIILFNLYTYGLDFGITFLTFVEIFIGILILVYIISFKPIKIEHNSTVLITFLFISLISYFSNINNINGIDFIFSSFRLLFWVLFMIIVFPYVKNDIVNNHKQFYTLIMQITMIVSLICIFQYIGYYLGLNQDLINLKYLGPIMRSHESRMISDVFGTEKIRPASIYVEPSFFALINILNTTYLLYWAKTTTDLNKCIFFLGTVILSNSFFGIIISLGLLVVIYLKYPKSLKTQLALIIFSILFLLYFPFDYIFDRITGKIYTGSTIFRIITPITHIIETLKFKPLFGLGWNNTIVLAKSETNLIEFYKNTGNIISHVITSTGIIGFILFILIFINIVKNKKNKLFLIILIMCILLSTGDLLIPYFWYVLLIISVIPCNNNIFKC